MSPNTEFRNAEAYAKFTPWFARINSTLRRDSRFPELEHQLGQNEILCYFNLAKDGKIDQLQVANSSGSKKLDQLATQIIANSAPFAGMPNDLLSQRGMAVIFSSREQTKRDNNPKVLLRRWNNRDLKQRHLNRFY